MTEQTRANNKRIRAHTKRPPFKKFFASVDETGEAIGQGRTKIYELIKENKLETVLAGRRRLVVVESIENYVASLRAAA